MSFMVIFAQESIEETCYNGLCPMVFTLHSGRERLLHRSKCRTESNIFRFQYQHSQFHIQTSCIIFYVEDVPLPPSSLYCTLAVYCHTSNDYLLSSMPMVHSAPKKEMKKEKRRKENDIFHNVQSSFTISL